MGEQEKQWREDCAKHEELSGIDSTRCQNCDEPIEFSNEYGKRWGTCNEHCYGVMVGVYPDPRY